MSGTKERILEAALELFSENGYEAVSVNRIAAKVGIKAPSLYKHYASKQDIFDSLIRYLDETYESRSLLSLSGQAGQEEQLSSLSGMSAVDFAGRFIEQLRLVTSDPVIARTRRLLAAEQFRNPVLAAELEKRQYTDVLRFNTQLIRLLIENGVLRDEDAELMALQLTAPVTIEMQRVDRSPSLEEEAERLIRQHTVRFFELYGKEYHHA